MAGDGLGVRVDVAVASAAVVVVSSAVTTAGRRTESGTVGGQSFPHQRFPACPPPRLPRRLRRRLRLGCSTHPSVCRATCRRRCWAVSAAASPAAAGSGVAGVAGVGRLPTTQAGRRPLAHKGSGWNQYCELGRPTERRRPAARGTDSPMNTARHEPESSPSRAESSRPAGGLSRSRRGQQRRWSRDMAESGMC